MKAVKTLDAQGLQCPAPIINLSKEMRRLNKGDVLEIIADDLAFEPDLKAWCNSTKNELVELTREGKVQKAYIKKA